MKRLSSGLFALSLAFALLCSGSSASAEVLKRHTGVSGQAKKALFKMGLARRGHGMSQLYSPVIQGRNGAKVTIFTRHYRNTNKTITMARVETRRHRHYVNRAVIGNGQRTGWQRSGPNVNVRTVHQAKVNTLADLNLLLGGR